MCRDMLCGRKIGGITVNRKQIVGRVANKVLGESHSEFDHALIEETLDAAGVFDLLEAAENLAEERSQNVRGLWEKLDAAIAKITGETP